MQQLGQTARSQAPPPPIVYAELLRPGGTPPRVWLQLREDEAPPVVTVIREGTELRWSSLWILHPDVVIDFAVARHGAGTLLTWTLRTSGPEPSAATVGHLRRRIQELINRDLRFSFGQ